MARMYSVKMREQFTTRTRITHYVVAADTEDEARDVAMVSGMGLTRQVVDVHAMHVPMVMINSEWP